MSLPEGARRARRPLSIREPDCIHSGRVRQPASACDVCCDGEPLRKHNAEWTAWLAENPDSPEARNLRALVKSGHLERLPEDEA